MVGPSPGSSEGAALSRSWKAGWKGWTHCSGPVVGEGLGGGQVAGEQPVLQRGEFAGQLGRPGVFGAVGADQGVVGDDDPLVVGVAEHEGAVPAVAAEEGVLPALGGPVLVGAVHGAVDAAEAGRAGRRGGDGRGGARGGVGHGRSTAAP